MNPTNNVSQPFSSANFGRSIYRAPFGAGLSGTSQLGFPVREAHSFNSYSASQQKAVYKDPDVDQRTKEKQPQSGVLLFSRQSI